MKIPTYMKLLLRAVLLEADKRGDSHPGWAAIHDLWDREDIVETLALTRCREPETAIVTMAKVADEIVANRVQP